MGGTGRQPHAADGIRMLERRRRRLPALRLRGEDGSLALGCGVHWSGHGAPPTSRTRPAASRVRQIASPKKPSWRPSRRSQRMCSGGGREARPSFARRCPAKCQAWAGARPGARSQGTLAVRASVGTCLGRNCGRPAMRRDRGLPTRPALIAASRTALFRTQQLICDPTLATLRQRPPEGLIWHRQQAPPSMAAGGARRSPRHLAGTASSSCS